MIASVSKATGRRRQRRRLRRDRRNKKRATGRSQSSVCVPDGRVSTGGSGENGRPRRRRSVPENPVSGCRWAEQGWLGRRKQQVSAATPTPRTKTCPWGPRARHSESASQPYNQFSRRHEAVGNFAAVAARFKGRAPSQHGVFRGLESRTRAKRVWQADRRRTDGNTDRRGDRQVVQGETGRPGREPADFSR